jgi:outer membrane protein assembly factor BamB
VATFGSQGLAAFDFEGRVKWRADLGTLNPGLLGDTASEWGHGSSPVLFEDLVLVQVDRHRDSYLAAYELESGRRVWSVNRDERPVWATPTVVRAGDRADLVVVGGLFVRGYDPRTGEERWRFRDEAEVKTPTPFVSDGLIVLSGGFRNRPIVALRPGGEGDLSIPEDASSSPHVAWRTEPGGPYSSTPVAYRGLLYGVRDEGILFAYDMRTGELVWRERTEASHTASLIASNGQIYVATEGGEVLVLEAGRSYRLLARNDMGESLMATPAIANRTLYVRGRSHLYAIGKAPSALAAQSESLSGTRWRLW